MIATRTICGHSVGCETAALLATGVMADWRFDVAARPCNPGDHRRLGV
jgi:hypothetical protein